MVSVAFLRLRAPQALALCFCAAVAVTGAAPSSHLAFVASAPASFCRPHCSQSVSSRSPGILQLRRCRPTPIALHTSLPRGGILGLRAQEGNSADGLGLVVGDKVRVVIKTISLSKKFNAAGLPSDVVGTVAEVWGVENEDEDGSGLTVAFEADEAAKSFDYTFSEWELEKVGLPGDENMVPAAAVVAPVALEGGAVDRRKVKATLALSPVGGGAGAPTQDQVLELLGKVIMDDKAFAQGNVETRFHPLGLTLVGTWAAVTKAAGVATDELLKRGATSAVVTLTMVVSSE